MPRPHQKKEVTINTSTFDTKVAVLKKNTAAPVSVRKPIPGVSSSVIYNEADDTVTVIKFAKGFGKAVKVARERSGLNQKQLASNIQKPFPLILSIEKEDAVYDKDLILRLEKALNVSLESFKRK
ncbi:hypothetical protein NECID01_1895 [Nematocida sp. AWRm77]|nr:hypothetical protein NECID01_1895 [Nematocida sp. AWRm77]